MNRKTLVDELAKRANVSKKLSKLVVDRFFEEIADALARGERVELRRFGSFKVNLYKSYKGRNPANGKSIRVSEKKLPRFKPSGALKKMANRKKRPQKKKKAKKTK
jgi:integration host factor subunit beta